MWECLAPTYTRKYILIKIINIPIILHEYIKKKKKKHIIG